ncbi:MAG: hypothetical protein M3R36_09375 [Bacteroidota bacterium]|nr:hypothetical protein [Bacteroidota bacterium]
MPGTQAINSLASLNPMGNGCLSAEERTVCTDEEDVFSKIDDKCPIKVIKIILCGDGFLPINFEYL